MEHISNYFTTSIKSLTLLGIWFDPKTFGKKSILVAIYIFFVNICFIFMSQICHFIYMYKARHNVVDFADEFYISLSSLMVVFKDYSLIKNFDKIQAMLKDIDSDIFVPKSRKQQSIIYQVSFLIQRKKSFTIHFTKLSSFGVCLKHTGCTPHENNFAVETYVDYDI